MDYSFCPMSPARDYTAVTLRNLALDDENMEVIAQMDAVAPLVVQAYLLTTGCALRASRRAAHAPKRDPLYNSCQFERLVRNNRWHERLPQVAQSGLGGRLRRDEPLMLPLPHPAHHHCLEMAGDVAMSRLLLKHRPNVDIAAQVLGQRDDDPFGLRGSGLDVRNGETPLHAALRAGNREMVLALRRHRTDRHEAEALDHQAFVRSLRRQRECSLELSAMDRDRCFWARLGVRVSRRPRLRTQLLD